MSLKAQSTSRNGDVEQATHEEVPRGRVEQPVRRVRAMRPEAGDDVRRLRQRHEACELGDVELQVGVGEEDPLQARRGDPRADRGAVAAVAVVHEHAHARVGRGAGLSHLAGGVGTAVVHDEDLVGVRDKLARRRGLVDCALDVLCLIVAGEDHREAAEAPDDVTSVGLRGDGGGASHGREDRLRT